MWRNRYLVGMIAVLFFGHMLTAKAEKCDKNSLSELVSNAGAELAKINSKFTRDIQNRLQDLKKLNGWSAEEFLINGKQFIQNEKIAGFEKKNKEILAKISSAGDKADCETRDRLDSLLGKLIQNNESKWHYMMNKLDEALEKTGSSVK